MSPLHSKVFSYKAAKRLFKKLKTCIVQRKLAQIHENCNRSIWTERDDYRIYIEAPGRIDVNDVIEFRDSRASQRARAIAKRRADASIRPTDFWQGAAFDYSRFSRWFGNEDAVGYEFRIDGDLGTGLLRDENYVFVNEMGKEL